MKDFGLILTYIMIGVTMLACIVSPILQIKNDSEKVKKMAIPVLGLIIIIIGSILIASNEVLPQYTNSDGILISSNLSKIVGGSLIAFYVLSVITIGSVIYSEFLYKFFDNGKK